ncbi:phage terminase large subunit [Myxococcus virescens]|uniref:phage terminase large subunit n=1 Tax=Myxococcus virescens TaxID=83456 RepID=UPI001428A897|nr:phage terminase large subunit [Myxococcus virescens]
MQRPSLAQIQTEKRRRRRRRAEDSLAVFVREAWHVIESTTPLEWNWHHDALCIHFQALIEDWMRVQLSRMELDYMPPEMRREMRERAARLGVLLPDGTFRKDVTQRYQDILMNVPPGTMKSRIVSVMGPCWVWTRWPEWRVLALSTTPDVALRDAIHSRDVLASDWYREMFEPTWRFSEDQDAKGNYKNTRGGQRQSKGITAKITGSRSDTILVDDPHDAKEIHSAPKREAVLLAWDTAIANRVNDLRSSTRLIIMQRLHERELAGHVLARGGVEHLCLPLEYEVKRACACPSCVRGETALGWKDPRTTEGEVLQQSRFPPEVVAAEKKRLGSYGAAGQLQQRPAPAGGGMFPRGWWRFHSLGGQRPLRNGAPVSRPEGCTDAPPARTPERFDRVFTTLDANFAEGLDSDPAVLWVVGTKGAQRFVLSRRVAHGYPDTERMLRQAAKDFPEASAHLVENKANGHAIVQTLRLVVPGVIAREPEGGKVVRAAALQPSVEAGDWHLLDGADWVGDVVEQFANFPRAAHDDDVDAASQGHIWLARPEVFVV